MSKNSSKSNNFDLSEIVSILDLQDLKEIIFHLIQEYSNNHTFILDWLKINKPQSLNPIENLNQSLNDELLLEYWDEAEEIIAEFNKYGGGPDDEEEKVFDLFEKMTEIIKENELSHELRIYFIDEIIQQYKKKNSGFQDGLMDLAFKICQDKSEWEYLVKKLNKNASEWDLKLIMTIQKNYLKNTEAYLNDRLKTLKYGLDYWDLISFYLKQKEVDKAISTAENGLKEGIGRKEELLIYLSKYYYEGKDLANLQRITTIAKEEKEAVKETMEYLFKLNEERENYDGAKDTLIDSFMNAKNHEYYKEYYRIINYLRDDDKTKLEKKLLEKIKKENLKEYMQICIDKRNYEEALSQLMKNPVTIDIYGYSEKLDEIADKLADYSPIKIVNYYWKKINA